MKQVCKVSSNRGSGLKFAQESGAYSVLLFLAEFLEARIAAEWIEIWIEPQERRGSRSKYAIFNKCFKAGIPRSFIPKRAAIRARVSS
jgi:hypothetical protein